MADEAVQTEIPLGTTETGAEYRKARQEGKTSIAVQEPEKEPEEVKTEEPELESEDKEPEQKPKSKSSYQKRLDRLTERAALAEERALAAERKAQELESRSKQPETAKPADGEPNPDDFKTYEEYTKALARWEVRQELKKAQEASEAQEEEALAQETVEAHEERIAAAREKYEDFDDVMNVKTPWPENNPSKADIAAAMAFRVAVMEDENSAEIQYYYGTHPDEFEALGDMTPAQVVKAVARLSDKLAPPKEAPKPKLVSKAPEPIKPVNGGASRNTTPLDQVDDMAEYKKRRAAGEKR